MSLYYHCASFLGDPGLSPAALLSVPVLGGALMWAQRRRTARRARD